MRARPAPGWARVDAWVAIALAAATILTRLPFATTYLWEWDSVLYARALEQGFHVSDVLARSRPHPPGYIFYVAAAALGRALGLASNDALVAVSVAASAAAAALVYLLCVRLAGRAIAVPVTLAFIASPLFWLDGAIAMPYALLAALSALLALSFLVARGGTPATVTAVSLAFGMAAGARQDLLIFLAPLWLWCLAPSRRRVWVAALGGLALGCLVWLVPTVILSDGPLAYLDGVRRQLATVSGSTGMGPGSVVTGAAVVLVSLGWGLAALWSVLLALLLTRGLVALRRRAMSSTGAFFLLWTGPALLFYTFVHIGEWGYVLSVLPGLFALTAHLLRSPFAAAGARGRAAIATTVTAAALISGGLFVAGGGPGFLSAAALRDHDRATADKVGYIRANHPPGPTVVLAGAELLVAGYYLPGYTLWFSDDRAAGTYERRLARDTTVVLYEDRATPRAPELSGARRVGSGLAVITLTAGTTLVLNGREVETGTTR